MRKHYSAALLLALPFLVAMVPAVAQSTRTIDVMLSRCAVSPEQIEVRLGERVRLNVTSMDGTPGFEVKELRLNAQLPAGGKTVMLDLVPTEAGAFEILSSNECGSDHNRMRARLVVTPE